MLDVVISSLVPVMLLIAIGGAVGRWQWVSPGGAQELSRLAFSVFGPALLFRTMSHVDPATLVLQPLAVYLGSAVALYWALWWFWGRSRSAAMWAMAAMFSNTVALGIPLVGYVYGPPGLVVLFTLISVHSLVLVSMITVNLEWHRAQNSRQAMAGPSKVALRATLSLALRQSIFHPVPMPILLGLAFSQTGWALPEALDRPLQWLGAAFGPMALLLVGINLAQVWRASASTNDQPQPWRKPMELTVLKNMVFPLCVGVVGWAVGLPGMPWAVMVLAAALPVGANVFLVSQRYALEREAITLGMSLSTVVGMLSLPVVMVLLQHWG